MNRQLSCVGAAAAGKPVRLVIVVQTINVDYLIKHLNLAVVLCLQKFAKYQSLFIQ